MASPPYDMTMHLMARWKWVMMDYCAQGDVLICFEAPIPTLVTAERCVVQFRWHINVKGFNESSISDKGAHDASIVLT